MRFPITASDKQVARELNVTPAGLHVLAQAVANGGELKGTEGAASVALEHKGLVVRHANAGDGRYGDHFVTDAGRDVVRRAREMGW